MSKGVFGKVCSITMFFNQKEENISHIPENARGALNPMDENIADKIKNVLSDKFR